MKSIVAAKMSAMRKRSALSSSAASSHEGSRDGGGIPKEPTFHHGKMRVVIDDSDPTMANEDREEAVDIVFCVALDAVHAVTDVDNTMLFETTFAGIKEIAWDHTECSLRFVLNDGTSSPPFIFATTLTEVEAKLTAAIRDSEVLRPPDQVYVGVLVGRNLPSSPIQQRRASIGPSSLTIGSVPATKRRELLAHERPPRHITAREALALQYFKSGCLLFPCSINGDARGLKLDGSHLYVFPSPDCYDRTACLFSYLYDQVDVCEVRGGTRLELRFHRSATKQPTFIALQALNAQYIRDAIWFFRHGMPMEVYYRRLTVSSATGALRGAVPAPPTMPTATPMPVPAPQLTTPGRRSSLTAFRDEGALHDRTHSRCVVIGCSRRCTDIGSVQTPTEATIEVDANGCMKRRIIWYCDEHTPVSSSGPGSPPRSPSKRSGLLTRAKSSASMATLIHSKHYAHSVRCHGTLQKSGGKYQLTKSWNPKIVALIETPVGGLLVYYDKLAHCPSLSDSPPRERRVIDLSSVMCIRRESSAVKGSATAMFAFDIVTVYRTWTFATSDKQEYEVWLHALSDAIEKHSSMAPDKVLRFPVKCLRDPFQNLPSRGDSTTSLEISSNGVTVCYGSDGESEVYNWYFTDIQKWSVAKQNDNTCCFLSCVSTGGTTGEGLSQSSSASVISTYHDFLFQTAEAEAICSAIEFFVGKCMAKLEVLVAVFSDLQSRQPSRRPSVEQPPAKTLAESGSSVKTTVTFSTGKQLPLEPVQLRPVGISPVLKDTEANADSQPTTMATLPPFTTKIDRISAADAACGEASVDESTAIEIQSLARSDGSSESPMSQLVIDTESKPISRKPLQLRIVCSPGIAIASEADVVEKENDTEISFRADVDEASDREESRFASSEEGDRDPSSQAAGESEPDELVPDDGVPSTSEARSAPPSSDALSPRADWLGELALVAADVASGANEVDDDADRFESFEYCECTIGTVDAVGTDDASGEGCGDADNDEEEQFEDARCGDFDASELSAAMLDGCADNDEDSLVLMEDEETSAVDIYGTDSGANPLDSVDELVELPPSEWMPEEDREVDASDEDTSGEEAVPQEITIPEFTPARFRRGPLQQQ